MGTLTRDEAAERARLLQIDSYTVDLDLSRGDEEFGSSTVIRFRCLRPGADTFVEIKPLRLRHAVLNGEPLDPTELVDNRLPLVGLASDNELRVEADMAYSRSGEGLHRFVDPADGEVYLYAQSFLDHAQRIYACFDQPDLKAPHRISVTAPVDWTVLSNGMARNSAPGRWEFAETVPLATYFVTLAAGRWHSVYQRHDGIPLGLHCRRSLAAALDPDVPEMFDITARCLDRYHELFTQRYPFGKYDQVFVPEFNAGAMENPGCVTFRDDAFVFRSAASETQREVRAVVIAHEMAHMWFGDLVTMRWWDDLWLNESFAEYMGHRIAAEATRFTETWTGFSILRKSWGYAADQRPSTHPVSGDVPDTARALLNFDGISYAKGASALRQLVTWIGDDAFLAGLNEYFTRHAYHNATLQDLLRALSLHTDRDLDTWARAWLTTAQVNTLRPLVSETADGRLASVRIEQSAPRGHPTLRPHRLLLGLYDLVESPEGQVVRRVDELMIDLDGVEMSGQAARTSVPAMDGRVRPALILINDQDLTYAKIRLDDHSWATVREHLHRIDDSLARAVLWGAAWDMVRDGELSASDYLELIGRHLPYETADATLQAVLGHAKPLVIDRYLPSGHREQALRRLAGTCRHLLDRAAPGSSRQVVAARAFTECAVDPADLSSLRAWLNGDAVPDGLRVDPQLRWSTLLRLVVTGLAGPEDIAAEAERDPSDEGQRGAARCRAALPDPQAKARAWSAISGDTSLTAHMLLATLEGFWQPEQAAQLAGYLSRYFDELPAIAERRESPEMAKALARSGFPGYAVSGETVTLAEKLLAGDRLSPGLARHLGDALDETRRAWHARGAAASG